MEGVPGPAHLVLRGDPWGMGEKCGLRQAVTSALRPKLHRR